MHGWLICCLACPVCTIVTEIGKRSLLLPWLWEIPGNIEKKYAIKPENQPAQPLFFQ
jgi:hypothetical protein